jgi:Flp pilus assembly protein TadD
MSGNRSSDGMALLEQARSQLMRADELTGGDPVVAEHLGDVHVLMNEKQRAIEYYEKAIELEPRLDEQPDLFEKLERLRSEVGSE